MGKKISEIIGLAFGGGLTWKVEEAYSYLMDYWEPGDQVFLFGFSGGAYKLVNSPCDGCLGLGRRLASAIDFNWRLELPASGA